MSTIRLSPVYGGDDPEHENAKFWAAPVSDTVYTVYVLVGGYPWARESRELGDGGLGLDGGIYGVVATRAEAEAWIAGPDLGVAAGGGCGSRGYAIAKLGRVAYICPDCGYAGVETDGGLCPPCLDLDAEAAAEEAADALGGVQNYTRGMD